MMSLCRLSFVKHFFRLTVIPNRNSALFINGPKATDTFVYVIPHIDLPERLEREEKLLRDIKNRKVKIDLDELKSIWKFYNEMADNKKELEKQKAEVANKINDLMKSISDSQELEKLKIRSSLIKENLKTLKVALWSVEENAVVRALKLPNELHERTPKQNTIIHTHLKKPENAKDHLNIGTARHFILYDDKSNNYYLKDDAAIFELGAEFYCSQKLRDHNFVQFSNADFVKSVVVEGCGLDHTDPDSTFILHHHEDTKVNIDNRLHLTGGASLMSFFAYHTKNVLQPNVFPLKYFSMGRQYVPADVEGHGLFNTNQSSAVQVFLVASKPIEMDKLLDDLINVYKEFYTEFGYHFRMSLVSADKLLQWESLRVSVEMYTSSMDKYIEVANISVSGDYISKRLLLTYKEKQQQMFPFVISGTLLNVPKLLGCVLEQDSDFEVPDKLKVDNWSIV